ncbi:ABC transporter permease [Prauserella alba]|uniref:ABC transporter permease n=1 Tax=Prauserella alba TaxID=176898 RepID=A0ABP4FQ60_9PSEU|nr:ABC transporter permease [Prauserella alba]MCP2180383.1 putative ABC transport system permease protein [Prauserella alba]
MFVAWRDLRFAKGRFTLMGSVVILMTLLVSLLTGLTAGLGAQSASAVTGLDADHITFAAPADGEDPSFTRSVVHPKQWQRLADTPGVTGAHPLGVATVEGDTGTRGGTAALSAFGVEPGSALAPGPVSTGTAILSTAAAEELSARPGDSLTLAGHRLTVGPVAGDASFNHTPVVWLSLSDWQRLAPGSGPRATVVALRTTATSELGPADAQLSTTTVTTGDALSAIGSYTAENGSLQLMRGFLFAIAALVIGAFFTVWTIQRSRDIAVLKALGATTTYLLRDALGQVVVLLVAGTGIGAGLAAGVGSAVADTVPFVLDPKTVLLPPLAMILLGVAGAALAVRRVTAVDPLNALSHH